MWGLRYLRYLLPPRKDIQSTDSVTKKFHPNKDYSGDKTRVQSVTLFRLPWAARWRFFDFSPKKIVFRFVSYILISLQSKTIKIENTEAVLREMNSHNVNILHDKVKQMQFYCAGSFLASVTRPRKVLMFGTASVTVWRIFPNYIQ